MTDEPLPAAPPPTEGASERRLVIPEETARRLEERLRSSAFPTLDAFVAYVLARLLARTDGTPFSEEDERRLKDQLRSLGYID